MAPEKMLCVAISTYAEPSAYELRDMPVPPITEPTDVQIKLHAASINPVDVKKASGMFKLALNDQYVDSPQSCTLLTSPDSHTKLATTALGS
jgi:NADPH:quinone reductase-like Zn-dependent oxidoreductase